MKPFDALICSRKAAGGFALVITLIMVVLAAIIAIGLLINASLDRTTAKSVDDRFKAEVAAENGLEAAKKALNASPTAATSITADDGFLVLRVDGTQTNSSSGIKDAYYYLAKAQSGTANTIDCYPLFAGGTKTTIATNLATTPIGSLPPPAASPFPSPAEETSTKRYPQVYSFQQAPYTQWQEIRNPNDSAIAPAHALPYQRYTYWVEDLGGYVDASVAGNTADAGSANKRPLDQSTAAKRYQTTPGEIALFTLFDPALQPDSGSTVAKDLINNRALQYTVATLKSIAPGPGNADITSQYLAARIQADSEVPLVPYGYGYQDEGNISKPKTDINAQIAAGGAAAVPAIATKINDNLPIFGPQRKGGLAVLDYVNTIAASMIDYADTNSDATVGANYRGIDSYPFVNEIYTMKWWKRTYLQSTFFVEIQMDTWVELWNPSNQTISGNVSVNMLENHPIQAGLYTYTFGNKSQDLPNGSSVSTSYPAGQTITVNMQPNEYTAYHLRNDLFELNTGVAPPLIFPAGPMTLTGTLASNYQLTWAGQVVDKAGGGIQRIGGSLPGPPNYSASNKRWRGSYPGFGYTNSLTGVPFPTDTCGDPRAAFYEGAASSFAQAAIAYDKGSSFWVRNNRSNVAATFIYSAVKPSSWPDRGHDTATVVTAPGNNSTVDPPTARPAAAVTEPTKAPGFISNAGSYLNLAELGNIFDPCQWKIVPDANNRWLDITSASTADGSFGGGMTLRVGRPEFTRFDQPGLRAWQLLDLFSVGPRIDTHGLININTASRDTLRALGAGVNLNRDTDILPAGVRYPPYQSKQADQFADAVIASRPFLSTSQLSAIKNSAASVFGNWTIWSSPVTEWNDASTEEYFAKVLLLSTVHSRNFRVFVAGQALDKDGRVLSTVNKVYQVHLTPVRDSTGKITSQNVILTYEAQLPL